jgi:hypothetical protein
MIQCMCCQLFFARHGCLFFHFLANLKVIKTSIHYFHTVRLHSLKALKYNPFKATVIQIVKNRRIGFGYLSVKRCYKSIAYLGHNVFGSRGRCSQSCAAVPQKSKNLLVPSCPKISMLLDFCSRFLCS